MFARAGGPVERRTFVFVAASAAPPRIQAVVGDLPYWPQRRMRVLVLAARIARRSRYFLHGAIDDQCAVIGKL